MKIHTVHKGESLATIAKQHGTTINAIAKGNNLSNINNLKIGQKLLIPCGQ
ncbi:LysM peptidoglycan-binding domain-containing protein [Moraxella sp. FZLJ2109]|uniref:LysM peptidoglycan-binding domain-containing protein n=1 Tax=unclassified Moraxella TaxID=2685852 RepID=UPI00353255AE